MGMQPGRASAWSRVSKILRRFMSYCAPIRSVLLSPHYDHVLSLKLHPNTGLIASDQRPCSLRWSKRRLYKPVRARAR